MKGTSALVGRHDDADRRHNETVCLRRAEGDDLLASSHRDRKLELPLTCDKDTVKDVHGIAAHRERRDDRWRAITLLSPSCQIQ